jgi:hypothetical protein
MSSKSFWLSGLAEVEVEILADPYVDSVPEEA